MPKNISLFYIAMTLYAFGFIASVILYSLDATNAHTGEKFASSLPPDMVNTTAGSIKVISSTILPIAPPLKKHDKNI